MPLKSSEAKLEYMRKYRETHKDKIKEWRDNNQDKIKQYEANRPDRTEYKKEYDKKYYQNNKDKLLQKSKDYYFTDEGKKNHRIVIWKQLGIKCDDFDSLYDKYIKCNKCELCNCDITEGKGLIGKKCLDHNHETGEFRNILCGYCNINVLRKK